MPPHWFGAVTLCGHVHEIAASSPLMHVLPTVVASLLVASPLRVDPPSIRYVNANLTTGANDGSSWANAHRGRLGLRDALQSAPRGPVEIWVAAGTYAPAPANGPISLSFSLRDDLALLGGFEGFEDSADERDPHRHATILTGDLNDNDGAGPPLQQPDNARHVVVGSDVGPSARLDGFIVERGRSLSSGGADSGRGGGILLSNASATIRACTVRLSYAQLWGGGVSIVGGAPTFDECLFTLNQASFGGSGVMHDIGATATFTACSFIENTGGRGAGFFNASSSSPGYPAIVDCTFEKNKGTIGLGSGPGLYDQGGSPLVERCTFRSNVTGAGGGGIYLEESHAVVRSCDFTDNRGTNDGGGGIYVDGGFVAGSGHPLIENSRLVANNGAIFVGSMGEATVVNCTIANNTYGFSFPTWPALVATGSHTKLHLRNSIVWGNLPANQPGLPGTVLVLFGASITADDCSIEFFNGSLPGRGSGPFTPGFVDALGDDGSLGTADDDVRLSANSSCIDRGDRDSLSADTTSDLDQQLRVRDGDGDGVATVDLGCYEVQPPEMLGDLDHDGRVGSTDLAILLGSWGGTGAADLNADGTTDASDLALILAAWSG